MKKITFVILFLLLFSLLFSANVYAAESEYKVGAQIELYLNSDATIDVSSLATEGYYQCAIDDPTVAAVEDGKLVAKSEGFTYISFTYKDYILHRNVIVHAGYEKVSAVKINNTTVTANETIIPLHVGEEYKVLINNDENVELSDTKVILQSSYEGVPVSEFVKISDEGKLQVVGVGKFELTIKLPTNKKDGGIKVIVDTSFSNSAFETAAIKYLNDNEYQLTCTEYDEKFITASELNLVEELTLTSVGNLPTGVSKTIFPNLKSVVIDLSQASNTSLGRVVLNHEDLAYKFIGNSGKTYAMQLASESMSYLKLSFQNFKFSYGGTALNLSKVATADVYFYGNCSIKSNNSSSETAVIGSKMNLVLTDGATVEIRGGNGATASIGAKGIEATHLSIAAKEFSQTASINIYGGNGGDASSEGQSGGHGSIGIKATSLVVKGSISCNVYGGSGGNGKAGTDKSSYNRPGTPGQASAGQTGTGGTKGADGGNGGHGGNGAVAVSVTTLQVFDVTDMKCIGGNGGDGANGGSAQKAGHGGKGGNTTGKDGSDAGDGGTGGTGGTGGRGGNGGNGSKAIQLANLKDLQSCQTLSLVHGYGGNAGSGGRGGDAGNGGDGGNDDHGGGFLGWGEGPEEGDGGSAGTGGAGGEAGSVGEMISSSEYFNISGIAETTAKHPDPHTASNGENGSAGTAGSAGDNGFK